MPTTPARPSSHSRRPTKPTVAPVEQPPNEFGKTLESLLGNKYKTSKVSEEELYAALNGHQIKQKYGERDARDWTTLFKFSMTDKPKGESKEASAERAANDVMNEFFANNSIIIPAEEAKKIKDTAFRLAQLDKRTDKLWDKYGGDPENTVAVTSFARAQRLMQERLDAEAVIPSAAARKSAKLKKLSQVG
jgi:hypothetical protein